MLKLSKAQYKQLCADCAAEMMRGAGHGGKIPDFSGTDMTFYVKDSKLKGGGFADTLSNTWSKVKQFVSFAWLLLLLSVMAHAMHYCGGDECDSDEDEPNTMYS